VEYNITTTENSITEPDMQEYPSHRRNLDNLTLDFNMHNIQDRRRVASQQADQIL